MGQYGFNHSRPELVFERRVELATWGKLRNLWGIWTGGGYLTASQDDRESRGGPVYPRPAVGYAWLGGETDTSRKIFAWGTASVSTDGAGTSSTLIANLQANLLARIKLTLHTRYLIVRGWTRWVETVEGSSRDHYLFGDIDRDELELKLSGLVSLHRLVTLQVFGQVLHSAGSYANYRELHTLADGTATLGRTNVTTDGDFATTRLLVNAILRWDLGAGTAAYLVYKLDGALDEEGDAVTGFDWDGALRRLTDEEQTHLLLLKVSYGFEL